MPACADFWTSFTTPVDCWPAAAGRKASTPMEYLCHSCSITQQALQAAQASSQEGLECCVPQISQGIQSSACREASTRMRSAAGLHPASAGPVLTCG